MKYYLVTLTLVLGECEKRSRHAVVIPSDASSELAERTALVEECHTGCVRDDDGVWDDGWFYKVHSTKELSKDDYKTYIRLCS